jgi:signal transduction histidine kinase/PAS domain-containing protein
VRAKGLVITFGGSERAILSMTDSGKTRDELINELQELRERLRRFEAANAEDMTDSLVRVQLDLALQLARARDLRDTLRVCVEAARQVAGMDAGGAYVRDRATGALRLVFSDGLSDEFVRHVSHFAADSVSTRLAMKGEPIHVDYQHLRGSLDDAPIREGLRATSIFPILYEGELVACLNVASRTLSELPPSRLHALNTIVSQVGNSIARARAQEALMRSEHQLRQAQALARLGSWELDALTGSISGSTVLYEIFGVDPGRSDAAAFLAAVHPEDRETVLAHFMRGIEQGEAWNIEHRLLCVNEVLKQVNTIGEPQKDEDGRTVTLTGTVQDITDRKRTETLLRIQRDLSLSFGAATGLQEVTALILHHSLKLDGVDAGGVYLCDPKTGRIDMVAHEGLPDEFVAVASHHDGESLQARLIAQGEPIYTRYADLGVAMDAAREKPGVRALAVIPVKDEGKVIGALNIGSRRCDELTEGTRNALEVMAGLIGRAISRARAQEEKAALQDLLRHAEKMQAIGHLAGGVAHDFNNQLTGILGYAELLRRGLPAGSPLIGYAERILLATKRSADLTGQLLAFARRGKYLEVSVDIHQTIREVVALLEHSVDKRITIETALDGRSHVVKGDPSQVQSALLNLAVNARDAMPNGGVLCFTTRVDDLDEEACARTSFDLEPGPYIQVEVSDTGVGMDRDVQARIFEPFFTTKAPGKGTGMGLAAVYGTVESHRAAVAVQSEPGKGTTFTLLFPLSMADEAEFEPADEARRPDIRASILLVDDERMVLEVTREMLSHVGYRVTTCSDGPEALRLFREQGGKFDLVILDLVMPNMGGLDLFKAMREVAPDVRVILASGFSVDGDAQRILDQGARAFLQKPYRADDLAWTVADVLGA